MVVVDLVVVVVVDLVVPVHVLVVMPCEVEAINMFDLEGLIESWHVGAIKMFCGDFSRRRDL